MGGYYRDRDRGSDHDRRPAEREESSDLRRRSGGAARCSAVKRRRWLRDGGRGGAGLSRRGACCCGVSIVFFYSLLLGRHAPAKRAAADRRRILLLCSASAKPGTKKTPPPLRIAPQAPAGNKSATRERVFFVTAWQRGGPCQVASFFSLFLLRRRRPADERSRARQTRTSGVPVPTWPIICAALRAISSRSQNRGKTLRFRAQVAWNGKSSGAMGRCRQAPS